MVPKCDFFNFFINKIVNKINYKKFDVAITSGFRYFIIILINYSIFILLFFDNLNNPNNLFSYSLSFNFFTSVMIIVHYLYSSRRLITF